jgi:hypothetical protein
MENYTIEGMITGADEISALFGNNEVEETAEEQKKNATDTQEKPDEEQETAETIDPLSLFSKFKMITISLSKPLDLWIVRYLKVIVL